MSAEPNPSASPELTEPANCSRGSEPVESNLAAFPERQRRLLRVVMGGLVVLLAAEWLWIVTRTPDPLLLERGASFQRQFRVDINQATWIEWSQLEGIGPSLAHRIVADREAHGLFQSVNDLERVPGIGPAKLDAMRQWLTIGHESVTASNQ